MDLILGTAQLTRPYGILQTDVSASSSPHEVLHAARNFGYAAIDTAPTYGEAEHVIGEMKLNLPIHTKIDPQLNGVTSVYKSTGRLGVDRLDVVYQHERFDGSQMQVERLEMIRDGASDVVEALGVSIYTRHEFEMALEAEVIGAIQFPLNAASREITETNIRDAQALGKKLYARSVFLQGVLATPPELLPDAVGGLRSFVREFHLLAGRWGIPPIRAAIEFVKSYEGLSGLVIGADNVLQVRQIAGEFNKNAEKKFAEECRNLAVPDLSETDPRTWSER